MRSLGACRRSCCLHDSMAAFPPSKITPGTNPCSLNLALTTQAHLAPAAGLHRIRLTFRLFPAAARQQDQQQRTAAPPGEATCPGYFLASAPLQVCSNHQQIYCTLHWLALSAVAMVPCPMLPAATTLLNFLLSLWCCSLGCQETPVRLLRRPHRCPLASTMHQPLCVTAPTRATTSGLRTLTTAHSAPLTPGESTGPFVTTAAGAGHKCTERIPVLLHSHPLAACHTTARSELNEASCVILWCTGPSLPCSGLNCTCSNRNGRT